MTQHEDTPISAVLDSTLTVQVLYDGDVTRLVAKGDLDGSSSRTFEAAADQAIAEGPTLVQIDLSEVDFIDSSGLRAIILLTNRANEAKIDTEISGISASARRVLEITGLIDTLRRS